MHGILVYNSMKGKLIFDCLLLTIFFREGAMAS